MTNRDLLLKRVVAVNPFPATVDLPEPLVASRRPVSDVLTDLGPAVEAVQLTEDEPRTPRRWKAAVVAVAGAVVVLVVLGVGSVLFGGADTSSEPVSPPVIVTTPPTVTTLPPTTVPPVETLTDPWGLGTVTERVTQSEVNLVFLAMPNEIDSMQASRDGPEHVGFVDYEGDETHASIAWFEAGPDSLAVIEFLDSIEASDNFTKETGGIDLGESFVWLAGRVDEGDREIVLLWWGDPTDGSIFTIEADTVEHRDALIDAYITSVKTPAPPQTSGSGRSEGTPPSFDEPSSWVGVEFETATEHPFMEGEEILANADYADLLIDGEPAGVYPWYVGGTGNAFTGPTFYALIVGDIPNPYVPPEIEMEAGATPPEPVPGDTHELLIWAISATSPTTYLVTDVLTAELEATLLGRNDLRSILMETYNCDLDTAAQHGAPFAFFAYSEDLEIEKRYPADYAFIVYNDTVQEVDGDTIQCVVRFDPENY